jgi:uncharacterized protein YciI
MMTVQDQVLTVSRERARLMAAVSPESGQPHDPRSADAQDEDPLIPDRFDEHTVIFLMRSADAPEMSEEALDALQIEHLTYLRSLKHRGVLIANGPLAEQTDVRMRGMSVYRLPLDEALGLARQDPMVLAGRLVIEGARWMTAEGAARFGLEE